MSGVYIMNTRTTTRKRRTVPANKKPMHYWWINCIDILVVGTCYRAIRILSHAICVPVPV